MLSHLVNSNPLFPFVPSLFFCHVYILAFLCCLFGFRALRPSISRERGKKKYSNQHTLCGCTKLAYSQTCLCEGQVGPVLSCFLDRLALFTACQLPTRDARPSLPLPATFPATAQPSQLYWFEVFNEFLIQFWLWNPASYCCLGLAFPLTHYQRTARKTSLVTAGLQWGGSSWLHVIRRPC